MIRNVGQMGRLIDDLLAFSRVSRKELERQPVTVLGTCIDAHGTIILPASAIGARVAVRQLKDIKVYRPNSSAAFTAEYLGQDVLTGWHFLRVEEKFRPELVPVTAWVRAGEPSGCCRPCGAGRRRAWRSARNRPNPTPWPKSFN